MSLPLGKFSSPPVKAHKDPLTGEYVYTLPPDQVVYRRLVGGLAWSGPETRSVMCALCILAEERERDFSTGQHKVSVVYESAAQEVEDILNEAADLQDSMKCTLWVTPTDHPEQVRVRKWQQERALRRAPRLTITSPPAVDFMVLHNLLLRRGAAAKTITFGKWQAAANQYAGVLPDDFYRPVRLFPHIASLLYALAALDMRSAHSKVVARTQKLADAGY